MEKNQELKEKIIKIGKEFLKNEIEDLFNLYEKFPEEIYKACEIILKCKGYVVVTGIGKSGHIGNKISATLASTGCPSFFIHPSEASHGDLGMIRKENVLIAISNSGESKELFDVLEYSKKISIPIIGITSKEKSTLGKFSDVILKYPLEKEACFMNLVPTSSTLMTLALGDTLAVCLYTLRNFEPANFKEFHPGGKLGKKLLMVRDVMRNIDEIAVLPKEAMFKDVVIEISKSLGGYCFIVDEHNCLLGIITDGDIRRNILKLSLNENVSKLMSKDNLIYCCKEDFIINIQKTLTEKRIMAMPVVEKENDKLKLLGMVHIHDINKSSS